jgi:outer membrane immunogenic protein
MSAPHAAFNFPAGFSHALGGWAFGAGVETALAGNWTAKLEYLYVDLGSTTDSFVASNFINVAIVKTSVRDNIVRTGVNYRWGGTPDAAAPIYVKAPVGGGWSGFYVGGNAGYGIGRETGHENFPFSFMGFSGSFTSQSFSLAPAGPGAGLQAGYNWQSGRWVAGLEGVGLDPSDRFDLDFGRHAGVQRQPRRPDHRADVAMARDAARPRRLQP